MFTPQRHGEAGPTNRGLHMTEADWDSQANPQVMLGWVSRHGSDRKVRLYAVACCRRVWELLTDERSRRAVDVAEAYADGCVGAEELAAAYYAAYTALLNTDSLDECWYAAARLANAVAYGAPLHGFSCTPLAAAAVADTVADVTINAVAYNAAKAEELAVQCHLLRDIFGNPFRTVSIGSCRRNAEVITLAQAIYDSRAFDRLPTLADALQVAGCDDQVLLEHCRVPGRHVRGCWVVDLLLGKE